jgi:hypothetical protein
MKAAYPIRATVPRLEKWDKKPKMIGVGHGAETRRDAERERIVV